MALFWAGAAQHLDLLRCSMTASLSPSAGSWSRMQGLIMVALVCGSTMLPDQCSRDTALDVIVSPARTPMDCALGGQAMAARSGLVTEGGTYLKISCERRKGTTDLSSAEQVR